jgi:hypothetical protein
MVAVGPARGPARPAVSYRHGYGAGARKNLKKAATRERSESPAADAVADAAAHHGGAAGGHH